MAPLQLQLYMSILIINLVSPTVTGQMGGWFAGLGNYTGSATLSACGEWSAYKTDKCVKPIGRLGTEDEAKQACLALDPSATLLTIESETEQVFMNNLLYPYGNQSDKAWLGVDIHRLVMNPWDRESVYQNWADGAADLVGYHQCVQMSLAKATLGKWSDEPCRRRALIVCQRRQEWTVQALREAFERLLLPRVGTNTQYDQLVKHQSKIIDQIRDTLDLQNRHLDELNHTLAVMNRTFEKQTFKLKAELAELEHRVIEYKNNSVNNATNMTAISEPTVPLGYVYVQLANQSRPDQLWPKLNWTEITGEYQGLFFRALGGQSGEFGQIQPANCSRLTNAIASALVDVQYTKVQGRQYDITEGGWTGNLVPAKALSDLYLYQSVGENRPINTAIRIWKRI